VCERQRGREREIETEREERDTHREMEDYFNFIISEVVHIFILDILFQEMPVYSLFTLGSLICFSLIHKNFLFI
jgi:hypothetical protein